MYLEFPKIPLSTGKTVGAVCRCGLHWNKMNNNNGNFQYPITSEWLNQLPCKFGSILTTSKKILVVGNVLLILLEEKLNLVDQNEFLIVESVWQCYITHLKFDISAS